MSDIVTIPITVPRKSLAALMQFVADCHAGITTVKASPSIKKEKPAKPAQGPVKESPPNLYKLVIENCSCTMCFANLEHDDYIPWRLQNEHKDSLPFEPVLLNAKWGTYTVPCTCGLASVIGSRFKAKEKIGFIKARKPTLNQAKAGYIVHKTSSETERDLRLANLEEMKIRTEAARVYANEKRKDKADRARTAKAHNVHELAQEVLDGAGPKAKQVLSYAQKADPSLFLSKKVEVKKGTAQEAIEADTCKCKMSMGSKRCESNFVPSGSDLQRFDIGYHTPDRPATFYLEIGDKFAIEAWRNKHWDNGLK